MRIKYMGPKEKKTVEYNSKIHVFTPECEVTDVETLKFLLHSDRKGLFEPVTSTPLADSVVPPLPPAPPTPPTPPAPEVQEPPAPEPAQAPAEEAAEETQEESQEKEKTNKGRGRQNRG